MDFPVDMGSGVVFRSRGPRGGGAQTRPCVDAPIDLPGTGLRRSVAPWGLIWIKDGAARQAGHFAGTLSPGEAARVIRNTHEEDPEWPPK